MLHKNKILFQKLETFLQRAILMMGHNVLYHLSEATVLLLST